MSDDRRIAFICDLHAAFAVGGAQRYYATLMREFQRTDAVTYVTRTFWEGAAVWDDDGIEVIGVTRRLDPAEADGLGMRAKLAFARGVLGHLLRHGGRYRVVHVSCFPHVAVIAARLGLLPHRRTALVADWHEVLPHATWRRRLGRKGELGWLAQRLAIGAGRAAVTFSRMHERRLREEGRRGGIHRVPEFPTEQRAPAAMSADGAREPLVVFAGRLVEEKRPHLVPAVLAELRARDDRWSAVLFGTGPERAHVEAEAARLGVAGHVRFAGFAAWEELSAAMGRGSAMVLPTEREGFGLAVLEASSHGLPAVLVAEEDNAAVELIEAGRNGFVCATADPAEQADAVLRLAADERIHESTRAWFDEHAPLYSVGRTAEELRRVHAEVARPCSGPWLPILRRLRERQSLIICHHGVGELGPALDPLFLQVPAERLRAQLELLGDAGFEFTTVGDLAARMDGGPVPPGLCALTFDDGMHDNVAAALPLLRELGVPATFYITTGLVGKPNPWLPDSGERMMTAEELRTLVAAGMELGPHTVTHPDLSLLDYDGCLDEMRRSADELAELTGRRWPTFAYPYGNYGEAAYAAARDAGFAAAVTTDDRGAWDDRLAIPRALIWGKDRTPSFVAKAGGVFWPAFRHPVVRVARDGTRGVRRRVRGAMVRRARS